MMRSVKVFAWTGALFGAAVAVPGLLMGCRGDVALIATIAVALAVAIPWRGVTD